MNPGATTVPPPPAPQNFGAGLGRAIGTLELHLVLWRNDMLLVVLAFAILGVMLMALTPLRRWNPYYLWHGALLVAICFLVGAFIALIPVWFAIGHSASPTPAGALHPILFPKA